MRPRTWIAAALLVGSSLAAPSDSRAQTTSPPPRMGQEWTPVGRVETNVGQPTTKGTWDGTWYYVNRDMRLALWLRTIDGKLQARLQYQSTAAPEAFETDWTGTSTYYVFGKPSTFKLILDKVKPDRI